MSSEWRSTKAQRPLVALLQIGREAKRQGGSHRVLARSGWPDVVSAFHDQEELGPVALRRLSKHTGLVPEDLCSTILSGAVLITAYPFWARASNAHPNRAILILGIQFRCEIESGELDKIATRRHMVP